VRTGLYFSTNYPSCRERSQSRISILYFSAIYPLCGERSQSRISIFIFSTNHSLCELHFIFLQINPRVERGLKVVSPYFIFLQITPRANCILFFYKSPLVQTTLYFSTNYPCGERYESRISTLYIFAITYHVRERTQGCIS